MNIDDTISVSEVSSWEGEDVDSAKDILMSIDKRFEYVCIMTLIDRKRKEIQEDREYIEQKYADDFLKLIMISHELRMTIARDVIRKGSADSTVSCRSWYVEIT